MTRVLLRTFGLITVALVIAAWLALSASPAAAQVTVDPKLPAYKPASGVSGAITSVGSDTMNNLMTLWGEGFKSYYPNVQIQIEGKGSSTAPPALIEGTANFGPLSRPMKAGEIDAFEKKYGYKPVELPTSIDMLAVYVNKDNPVASVGLTMTEVDGIFSRNRKRGGSDLTSWGQLGLKGSWSKLPISLYGRNSASGTYGYFKEHALAKGDYKDSVKEQPGSSAVVQGVASDKAGIGYSGIGYMTADVKAVPLSIDGGDPVPAEAEFAYSGEYPLARFLLLAVNYKPGTQLDPLRREFVRFIFSKQGQEIVLKDGYLPVTAEVAAEALRMVGIE